jgi:hypothetical protein
MTAPNFPSKRGDKDMDWPLEDIERVRVKGFSILDDDFNVMAGDLCSYLYTGRAGHRWDSRISNSGSQVCRRFMAKPHKTQADIVL